MASIAQQLTFIKSVWKSAKNVWVNLESSACIYRVNLMVLVFQNWGQITKSHPQCSTAVRFAILSTKRIYPFHQLLFSSPPHHRLGVRNASRERWAHPLSRSLRLSFTLRHHTNVLGSVKSRRFSTRLSSSKSRKTTASFRCRFFRPILASRSSSTWHSSTKTAEHSFWFLVLRGRARLSNNGVFHWTLAQGKAAFQVILVPV